MARNLWRESRLLIVNHSLLASHFVLGGRFLPEFSHLVVDEAHRFPDTFHEAFISSASFSEMEALFHEVGRDGPDLTSLFEVFRSRLTAALTLARGEQRRLTAGLALSEARNLESAMEKCARLLAKSMEALQSQQELGFAGGEARMENSVEMMRVQARIERVNSVRSLVRGLLAGPAQGEVLWLTRVDRDGPLSDYRVQLAPLRPGELLQEKFFPQLRSVVFTSATLAARASDPFAYFARELGYSREAGPRVLQLDSPFAYRENSLLYLPGQMPDPSRQEDAFHRAAAGEIQRLLELTHGGAFVLFTSRRSLRAVQSLLGRSSGNYTLISQVAGDRLRLVILVRLPFRVPDEPLHAARMEEERAAGRDPFQSLQLPQAVISMKQGYGRLIRSVSDRGIVSILDPRLRTKGYGRDIMQTLPDSQRVYSFNDLTQAYKKLFN